jgi:hypothetical protein
MVVLPLIHVFWGYVASQYYGWKWGLFSCFVLQPAASWASILFGENGFDIWQESRPLFKSILYGGEDYKKRLLKLRKELAKLVRETVETMGPKLYGDDFEKMRIIKQESLRDSSNDTPGSRKKNFR